MASKLSGIELTRYDDLFKTDAEREADRQERIQIVPASEVFPYSRQPYTIDRPTPDLVRLMDSIEHIGIAEPLIVRPRDAGGYEIISGHRRDYCAKAVGLDTRPVIVRNYSDEEADILVVDYNINREDLLPSEKAKAYKLKLDAMKRQGQRTDLTSRQLGTKLLCYEIMGKQHFYLPVDKLPQELMGQRSQFIMLPDLVRGVPVMPVTATFAQNGSCTIQLEHGSYVVGEMVNQEYHITARVRVGSAEFVMGECEKAPAPFVTWQRNCKNDGDGPPNFFWGHYRSDRSSCIDDFCERAGNEYKKQQNRTAQQEQNRTTPKKERGESR